MNWWKRFKPKACSINLKSANKTDALVEVVSNLVSAGLLSEELRESACEALQERESLASTGVGMNVAIPHVKLEGLESAICSLSIHATGLDWNAVDGAEVRIVFTVLRPANPGDDHDPEEHLEMMRWLAKLAREADFRNFAMQAKTKTELVDLLKEMSAV